MLAQFDVPSTVRLRDVSRPAAGETRAEAIARLAQKAVISGVKLMMESSTEAVYATSATMPTIIYAVGPDGCSCAGFQVYRRCMHHSLFVVENGAPTDPPAAAAAECERLESLNRRGLLRTTGELHRLANARQRVA